MRYLLWYWLQVDLLYNVLIFGWDRQPVHNCSAYLSQKITIFQRISIWVEFWLLVFEFILSIYWDINSYLQQRVEYIFEEFPGVASDSYVRALIVANKTWKEANIIWEAIRPSDANIFYNSPMRCKSERYYCLRVRVSDASGANISRTIAQAFGAYIWESLAYDNSFRSWHCVNWLANELMPLSYIRHKHLGFDYCWLMLANTKKYKW